MLHKAWPTELKRESPLNEKEKDEILLRHLLTWSTWPGFLKFFGKKFMPVLMLTPKHKASVFGASTKMGLNTGQSCKYYA